MNAAAVPDADGLARRTWTVGEATLSALEAEPAPDAGGDGAASADTIVLLHGIPASAELWRGVMPRLAAAGHHVVAFDLPGYGQTSLPAQADHSLAGAAEAVATWIRVHGGGGAWVVGHDLGGGVAQILATRHPRVLRRLTLADAVHSDTWPVLPVALLSRFARAGLYPAMAAARLFPNPYARQQLRRGFADPAVITDELKRRVFWDRKVTAAAGRQAFAQHLRALDPAQTVQAAGSLPRVEAPCQLLWGDRDEFQPWDGLGMRLRDLLPGPDVTLLEDTGHYAPLERPDAFAQALLHWESSTTS